VILYEQSFEGKWEQSKQGRRGEFAASAKNLLTIGIVPLYSHKAFGKLKFQKFPDWGGAIDGKLATLITTAKGGK
jgi:hypothetical protein